MQPTRQSDFGLFPPPRAVPGSVCVRVLFGGLLNQFGWSTFFLGSIAFWYCFPIDEVLWQAVHARGTLVTASGVVLESAATGAEEGMSDVYAVTYAFTARDGVERRTRSFTTRDGVRAGAAVTVEYPPGRPWISKVREMRRSEFGLTGCLVALFPVAGLGIGTSGIHKGSRAIRLLRSGKPAVATFVTKWKTGASYNEYTIYQITFDFTDEAGRTHRTRFNTYKPEALDDGKKKVVLYDPKNPEDAVLLDALPEIPTLDGSGGIRPAPPGGVYRALAAPTIAVAGHTVYAYLAWMAQSAPTV